MIISSRQAQVESLLQLTISDFMTHIGHSSKHREHSLLGRCWKLQRCVYLLKIEFQNLLLHYEPASSRHFGDTLLRLPCYRMLVHHRLGLKVRSSRLFQRGLKLMSRILVPSILGVPVHEVIHSPKDILVLVLIWLQSLLLLVGLFGISFAILSLTRFSGLTLHVYSFLLNS